MNTIDWMRLSAEKNAAAYRELTNGCITTESDEKAGGHRFLELKMEIEISEEINKISMFLLDYAWINGEMPPCMDIKRIEP